MDGNPELCIEQRRIPQILHRHGQDLPASGSHGGTALFVGTDLIGAAGEVVIAVVLDSDLEFRITKVRVQRDTENVHRTTGYGLLETSVEDGQPRLGFGGGLDTGAD